MNSQFLHDDCQAILPTIPEDSIDLMVTDPPYGMAFMGKAWDKALPSVAIWQECLRVLKPGAFAFIMCIPRQDCLARMIVNLEDAGFVVGFSSLYWNYATGFPKAQNIGKVIDKRQGVEREVVGKYQFPDKGQRQTDRTIGVTDLGLRGQKHTILTAPATPEAKALDGAYAGCQMKPAVEVILVVMKPLSEKTYVDQALANQKGVTWLDDCRIPFRGENDKPKKSTGAFRDLQRQSRKQGARPYTKGIPAENNGYEIQPYKANGRFPANLLVSDDVLNDGILRKTSGTGKLYHNGSCDKNGHIVAKVYGKYKRIPFSVTGVSGSFSRYFSLDAWWTERIKSLPESVQTTFPYLIVPKPAQSEKTVNGQVDCTHPTVKPLKLMSYLITLGSREGDIVLDPFSGHGTTAAACKLLDRQYLAIEQEQGSFENAKRRVGLTAPPPQLALCF